jgi:integrase
LLVFLLETGVRIGEALALEASDIDKTGVVSISKTAMNYDRIIPTIKHTTKTASGTRNVKLRSDLHAALADRSGRVFPYTYAQVRSAMARAVKRANLHEVTPHVLRHTACTLLLRFGVSVKTVSATLGHEDAAFTLNTYAKFIPTDLDSVPAAWEGIFRQERGMGTSRQMPEQRAERMGL